jgi:hypothetical protein
MEGPPPASSASAPAWSRRITTRSLIGSRPGRPRPDLTIARAMILDLPSQYTRSILRDVESRELQATGGTAMAVEHVNISIEDDYLDRFSDVVQHCEEAGLKVEQELEGVGVVTGLIDSDKLADLEQVEGVAAVESERQFQLSPPDSEGPF